VRHFRDAPRPDSDEDRATTESAACTQCGVLENLIVAITKITLVGKIVGVDDPKNQTIGTTPTNAIAGLASLMLKPRKALAMVADPPLKTSLWRAVE
jgi:hypothetical protein